jgi:CRISPR-associated endonuclease/helicase Cas3
MTFYARSDRNRPGLLPNDVGAKWQPLWGHLLAVAELAKKQAEKCRPDDPAFAQLAYWCGLLHDLGKYHLEFQQMLMDVAMGKPKARVNHSGHGAALAFDLLGVEASFAIAGHHAGLSCLAGPKKSLEHRIANLATDTKQLLRIAREDFEAHANIPWPEFPVLTSKTPNDLKVRMLSSCLIDADRLDAAGLGSDSHPLINAPEKLASLLSHIKRCADKTPVDTVRNARSQILTACLESSSWPERLLSLTVPTSGAKTLSSIALALKRAIDRPDEVRRIIVVVPYLSIIEQTAEVYAKALGSDIILEHHSGEMYAADDHSETPDPAAYERKLAVENWDAPIVITTSIRFFESLFSNRPRDLRRLHNIARSVVILDEIQTVPPGYLRPILSMIKDLSQNWQTSFVFCTATQPAFERPQDAHPKDPRWPPGTIREIIPEPTKFFNVFQHAHVFWPGRKDYPLPNPCSWDDLTEALCREKQVLCIVNLKDHATTLYGKLIDRIGNDGVWHLSARMCPRHRSLVLDRIRADLREERPCHVISTQLLEAGVDISFPVIFRAIAPFDSIAHTKGRADREGQLTVAAGEPAGRVIVFIPNTKIIVPKSEDYQRGLQGTKRLLAAQEMPDVGNPRHIRGYFNGYYDPVFVNLDKNLIEASRLKLDFRSVAKKFRYIEGTTGVLVPFDEGIDLIAQITDTSFLTYKFWRKFGRQIQRHQVGLYPWEFDQAKKIGAIYALDDEEKIWACRPQCYLDKIGLVLKKDDSCMIPSVGHTGGSDAVRNGHG